MASLVYRWARNASGPKLRLWLPALISIRSIMKIKSGIAFLLVLLLSLGARSQNMKLALLVYGGGGDWYANPTSLKNLAAFCNQQLGTRFDTKEAQVEVGSPD